MTTEIINNTACDIGLLDSEIRSVNNLIDQNLVSLLPACNKLIRYFRAHSGKMIRPKLLLLSAGACGKINEEHILSAAIFQIIHDATLLHDDVIDEGQLRRNTETINSRWGNKIAVLTGDFLIGHALKMCLYLSSKAMEVVVEAVIKTCEGEISQDFNEQYENISENEYIRLIQMKSAEMFSQCCYLGALLSGANDADCQHLRNYGLFVGTAYQISDDIQDICSNDDQIGKSSGRDIKSKVITLPVIHYIQNGGDRRLLKKMSRRETFEELIKSGSIEYCQRKIESYCNAAIEHLKPLVDSEYKYLLKNTAELIASRSYITQFKYIK